MSKQKSAIIVFLFLLFFFSSCGGGGSGGGESGGESGSEPLPPPMNPGNIVIAFPSSTNGSWVSSAGRNTTGNPIYEFTLNTTTSVIINLSSPVDTYLYLLDAAGSILNQNDDIIMGNTNSEIQRSLSAGTYQVVAATFNVGQSGNFTLTLSDNTPPPPPPISQVALPYATSGSWTSSGLPWSTTGNPSYTFTLNTATDVAVVLNTAASLSPSIYLVDSLGTVITFQLGNNNHTSSVKNLLADTYTLIVSPGTTGTADTFDLEIFALGANSTANVTLPYVGSGTWNPSVADAVAGNPAYTFTLTQSEVIEIKLTSPTSSKKLFLSEATGAFSMEGSTNGNITRILPPGTYTVVPATTGSSFKAAFMLSIRSVNTPTQITAPAQVNIPTVINDSWIVDASTLQGPLYHLTLGSPQNVSFEVTSTMNLSLTVYDKYGGLIKWANPPVWTAGVGVSNLDLPLGAGDFFITVSNFDPAPGDFALSVNFDNPPIAMTIPGAINGTWSTVTGLSSTGAQVYNFTVLTAQSFFVTSNSLKSHTLFVYDVNAKDMGLPWALTNTQDEVLTLDPGNYNLVVHPGALGATFTIDITAAPSPSLPVAITVPTQVIDGWVNSYGDQIYGNPSYSFTLTQQEVVMLNVTSASRSCLDIIDASGMGVAFSYCNAGSTYLEKSLAPGDYTVVVSTFLNNVTDAFTLDIYLAPKPVPIQVGTPENGVWEFATNSIDSNPSYTFTLAQQETVVFNATSAAPVNLRLLDSFGVELQYVNGNELIQFLPAGDYKIVVSTSFGSAGNFTLAYSLGPPVPPPVVITIPYNVNSSWGFAYGFFPEGNPRYNFTLATSQAVFATLTSTTMDNRLILLDGAGNIINTFGGSLPLLSTEMSIILPPGDYSLVVAGETTGGSDNYTLDVSFGLTPVALTLGTGYNGAWASTTGASTVGNLMFTFSVPFSKNVLISLEASNALFYLLDSKGTIITVGSGSPATGTSYLQAGEYQLIATTQVAGGTGPFILTVN